MHVNDASDNLFPGNTETRPPRYIRARRQYGAVDRFRRGTITISKTLDSVACHAVDNGIDAEMAQRIRDTFNDSLWLMSSFDEPIATMTEKRLAIVLFNVFTENPTGTEALILPQSLIFAAISNQPMHNFEIVTVDPRISFTRFIQKMTRILKQT